MPKVRVVQNLNLLPIEESKKAIIEAGINLIGGQPFPMANLREVSAIDKAHNIMLLMDNNLINEPLYYIKIREEGYLDMLIKDILHEMRSYTDFSYFSGCKVI